MYKHIVGKWNHHLYRVISRIGGGENGEVFLVHKDGKKYALKIGYHQASFFSEVNGLGKCMKAQGDFLGPLLVEVDDWDYGGTIRPFYVMEYIEGESFPGKRSTVIDAVPQLLKAIDSFHKSGFAYGDLGPNHLLIEKGNGKLRLVDFGGLTPFGQSVKEYTPLYDRGSWGAGERKASASYDLFSVCMIIIVTIVGKSKLAAVKKRSPQKLYDIIQSDVRLKPFSTLLMKGIHGQYESALHMLREWERNLKWTRTPIQKNQFGWVEALFVFSLCSFGLMVWLNYM